VKKEPLIIASDHAGFALKVELKLFLSRKGFKVVDAGTYSTDSCDYPDFVSYVGWGIMRRKFKRGILVCKSGIGSAIAANKFRGVRAALCYNALAARLSREHNDSNVLVLGSVFVSVPLAKKITAVWLTTEFQGGRHIRRLNKIKKIEQELQLRSR